ncbi:hypothetical protein, conserved [Eimeria maxima]|uniref:Uncharacterized protein n=1 Tax=Eimeria maxima TaxID=5804 RepID=U6M694_EIMMA|nr:hypothetical protein, conserved [Eimeria maxima]CDJ59752.1 hypothetical protein, conserved [Eimeria maxima]
MGVWGGSAAALASAFAPPFVGNAYSAAVLLLLLLQAQQVLQVVAAEVGTDTSQENAANQGSGITGPSSSSSKEVRQQHALPSEAKDVLFAAAAAGAEASEDIATAAGAPGAQQEEDLVRWGGSSVGGSLSNSHRYSFFSGRPSCPSRNPEAQEKRMRAAAAAGAALLQSHFVHQERWLLLQRSKQKKLEAAQQQAQQPQQQLQQQQQRQQPQQQLQQQHQVPSAGGVQEEGTRLGVPREQKVGTSMKDVLVPVAASSAAAATAAAGSLAAKRSEKETGQRAPQVAPPPTCPLPPKVSPFFLPSLGEPLSPLETPQVGDTSLQVAMDEKVYREALEGTGAAAVPSPAAALETRTRMQQRMQQENRPTEGMGFRNVLGGLEVTAEEGEWLWPTDSLHANLWGFSKTDPHEHASWFVTDRRQGAAVGIGDTPELTWVLGAPLETVSSTRYPSPSEVRAALMEALELTFRMHAQDIQKGSSLLGNSSRRPHAGAPHAATLQFSFDVVPLHEQRLIHAESEGPLGPSPIELVGELLGETFAAAVLEVFERDLETPAQAQLSRGGTREISLVEGGLGLHAKGHADQWMRRLVLPEELTRIELLALTLQELRLLLALEEEMGGPQAPLPSEDWAPEDREERLHFLWPPQELHAHATANRQNELQQASKRKQQQKQQQQKQQQHQQEQQAGEADDDYLLEEEEAFWELMMADPGEW